jgi:DNA-binding transcriptional ArsR family regulator
MNERMARRSDNLDSAFRALADRSRRALLDRLAAQNGLTLGELCARLQMSRQGVTKHLRILEAANLVSVVWNGREKLHYLNPLPIHEISKRWIHKFEERRLDALEALKHSLEGDRHGKNK